MGSKNHAIIMPDASMDATLNALVAAGFGAAGQRCMALSTTVFVGSSMPWYLNVSLRIVLLFFLYFALFLVVQNVLDMPMEGLFGIVLLR